jgi:hypothetical protein
MSSNDGRLEFSATLELATGLSLFASPDPEMAQANANCRDEFLMTLKAEANVDDVPWLKDLRDEEVELVLILDRSIFMEGRPWVQAQVHTQYIYLT